MVVVSSLALLLQEEESRRDGRQLLILTQPRYDGIEPAEVRVARLTLSGALAGELGR
jgi:hypothetical protein